MRPDWIKEFVLPHVDMTGLSQTAKAVVLTAMYDLDEDDPERWQQCIDVFKQNSVPSPLYFEAYRKMPYSMWDYFKNLTLPYYISKERRFEHAWVCARHGSGKTTLLENMIFHDLQEVSEKRATVLVMDSQGKHELLGRIERSFPCTVIDTSTPMNIFARPRRATSAREAEIMYTSQIDLITYVFSATLGDGGNFTPKQRTLWTYLVQLVLEAQGTVADILKLLLPKGLDGYRSVIDKLPPPARVFFSTQFDDPKQYTDTKKELHWRLDSILQRPSFARMFTQKKALDLYGLLQTPQCILVDTDKALLGQDGTEIFGRFIIAMLLSASQQRGNVHAAARLPTYVYIDECQDYISTDKNIATIIDQARKMKIALTLAHQREAQIREPMVLDALRHCGIRLTSPEKHLFELHDKEPVIVKSPPVERKAIERKNVPTNTVTPFVYEGEVIPPEKPRGISGPDDETAAR